MLKIKVENKPLIFLQHSRCIEKKIYIISLLNSFQSLGYIHLLILHFKELTDGFDKIIPKANWIKVHTHRQTSLLFDALPDKRYGYGL